MLVAASRNRSDSASRSYASPPSYVKMRRRVVRTAAVWFARRGRFAVPENFVIVASLLALRLNPVRGHGGRAFADLNGGPVGRFQKNSRPAQLTGSVRAGLRTRRRRTQRSAN